MNTVKLLKKGNKKVLDDILELGRLNDYSYGDIAEELNISVRDLLDYQDDTLEDKILKDTITKQLEDLYRDLSLDFRIDYLRITFKHNNLDKIFNEILRIDRKYFLEKDYGLYGYKGSFELENIIVFTSDEKEKDTRGVLIQMSGQGCELFTSFLAHQKRTWFDFLNTCKQKGAKFPRIDLACDDYVEYINLHTAYNKIQTGEFQSKFRTFKPQIEYVTVTDENNKKIEIDNGLSLYFGSKLSELHIIFYQKNKQLSKKINVPIENINVKNRYEIRFSNDYAYSVVEWLVKNQDISEIVLSVLFEKITFLTRDKKKVWKNWLNLLGQVKHHKLRYSEKVSDYIQLRQKENYLIKQAYNSVLVFKAIDEKLQTNILEKIENTVEEKENVKREHLIKIATTELKDMIIQNF